MAVRDQELADVLAPVGVADRVFGLDGLDREGGEDAPDLGRVVERQEEPALVLREDLGHTVEVRAGEQVLAEIGAGRDPLVFLRKKCWGADALPAFKK